MQEDAASGASRLMRGNRGLAFPNFPEKEDERCRDETEEGKDSEIMGVSHEQ